jgi:SAM-dependent methyltransferase
MRPVPDQETGAEGSGAPGPADHERFTFGEYYYAHDCGIPYERNEHWSAFFGEIADRLVVALDPKSVLDAGCAIGMLVEALRARDVEAYGIDVSEWAIENMPDEVRQYCRQGSLAAPIEGHYDLVTCIEVIEHIPQPDDIRAVEQLCRVADRILLSSSPHDYSEPTHVNVRPPEDWAALFARQGFVHDVDFDASFLTPWAVLFRRSDDTLPEVVRRYERSLVRTREEITQLRTRALQMQDQLEKDYSAASVAELRQELLSTREELVTATADAGVARGRVRELEDERDAYQGAADELAGFKRSKVWSTFELYARVRRKIPELVGRLIDR